MSPPARTHRIKFRADQLCRAQNKRRVRSSRFEVFETSNPELRTLYLELPIARSRLSRMSRTSRAIGWQELLNPRDNLIEALACFEVRKEIGQVTPHALAVPIHHG